MSKNIEKTIEKLSKRVVRDKIEQLNSIVIERSIETLNSMIYRNKLINIKYKSEDKKVSIEKLTSNIETSEHLTKTLKLPLKVRGVFLTEGRPKRKYYTAEELAKSVDNPMNKKFPLMLDHRDKEAGKVIGMVDKISFDATMKGVRWWGHVNAETFARNVLDGAIKEVSATIYSVEDWDEELGVVGKDLTYKELSLVMAGAEKNNYIEAY